MSMSGAAHADAEQDIKECANCGSTESLARCSRCHAVYFCSVKCQKAYWPFHRTWCRRNDFADAIEANEPKFARWMRKHGKQAVLKDDEVERMERQGHRIIETMYGRANPKPREPSYSPEELVLMERSEQAALVKLAEQKANPQKTQWDCITYDGMLGGEVPGKYKWVQNQSFVEAHFLLPPNATGRDVDVQITSTHLRVEYEGAPLLAGELYRDVKADDSTWLLSEGIITVNLLKRNRRGHYANGTNNSHTYWRSLIKCETHPQAVLPIDAPPDKYYFCEYDKDDQRDAHTRRSGGSTRRGH